MRRGHQLLDEVVQTHFSLFDESCNRERGQRQDMTVESQGADVTRTPGLLQETRSVGLLISGLLEPNVRYRTDLCSGLTAYATTWVTLSNIRSIKVRRSKVRGSKSTLT